MDEEKKKRIMIVDGTAFGNVFKDKLKDKILSDGFRFEQSLKPPKVVLEEYDHPMYKHHKQRMDGRRRK